MRTKITRLLQVGDIHLPDWPNESTQLDVKDKHFSKEIIQDLTEDRLSMILSALNKVANSRAIDSVVLMGDLTSRGQTEHIGRATKILSTLLQDAGNERQPIVCGVPGNHDVSKSDAALGGPITKFEPIRTAFREHGFLDIPVEDCVFHAVKNIDGTTVDICLLNTSIGSMSIHLLPSNLQNEFSDSELHKSPLPFWCKENNKQAEPDLGSCNETMENRVDQLYNQLDTPYISRQSLRTLLDRISGTSREFVLICGHHNILPQRIPRVTPYAEMLNAGLLRDALLETGKLILYLHGHIHESPIEQIIRPKAYGAAGHSAQIISVSAPPIWDGFNEIGLFHDENEEIFLVRVTEYRPNRNGRIGNFSDQMTRYFPLITDNSVLMTKNARRVWDKLRDVSRLTWSELVDECAELNLPDDDLEHLAMLLFCSGAMKIANLGKPRHKWRIEFSEMGA